MNKLSLNLKNFNLALFLIFIPFFLFFISIGVKIAPDSAGYLSGDILRPPLYPLLLKLNHYFFDGFGEQQFLPLIMFQIGLGAYAVHRFSKIFISSLKLNFIFYLISVMVCLSPYFGCAGNYLLTEAIGYPLFLLAVEALILSIRSELKSFFYLLWFFFLSMLLTLVRGQFLFLYVVGIVAAGYLFWFRKKSFQPNFKKYQNMLILAACLGLIITGGFLERLYHQIYHQQFTATPSFAVHFVIAPLYLSKSSDADLFQDSILKALFLKTREKMEAQGLTSDSSIGNIDPPFHFYSSFDLILYKSLYPAKNELQILNTLENEKRYKTIGLTLIKAHPFAYAKLYLRNLTTHFDGYYGFLFVLSILTFSAVRHFKLKDFESTLLFFVVLLDLGNASCISLVQAYHLRYSFYTHILLFLMLFYLLYNYFLKGEAFHV